MGVIKPFNLSKRKGIDYAEAAAVRKSRGTLVIPRAPPGLTSKSRGLYDLHTRGREWWIPARYFVMTPHIYDSGFSAKFGVKVQVPAESRFKYVRRGMA
ncbi:hypothetical protein EVAR_19070_1 [Eumeta japonica]|uniref:Uncharacterized protein n=1 Tax=Eumeta variegata TaxID=151549 RepID=A0A4C1UQG8_EUMVA|nr:hypothetical protein EVAR_19070_1 [Eumeta japonica]